MKDGNDTNEKFLLCNCYGEGLLVIHETYETLVGDEMKIFDKEFHFAVFRNYTFKPNMWERLKYAWYHLRTGKVYEDQIILDYGKSKQLADFLVKKMESFDKK